MSNRLKYRNLKQLRHSKRTKRIKFPTKVRNILNNSSQKLVRTIGHISKLRGILKSTKKQAAKKVRFVQKKYNQLSPRQQKILYISFVGIVGMGLIGLGAYAYNPTKLLISSANIKARQVLKNTSEKFLNTPQEVSKQDSTWKSWVNENNIAKAAIILTAVSIIFIAQASKSSTDKSVEQPISFDLLTRSTPPTTKAEKQEIVTLVTNIGRHVMHAIATSGFYGVSLAGTYSNVWCHLYCAERCANWALFKCLKSMMPIAYLHPTLARLTLYSTNGPYNIPDFYDPMLNIYPFMP